MTDNQPGTEWTNVADALPAIGVLVWMWDGVEILAGCRVGIARAWCWAGVIDGVWYSGGRWVIDGCDERNDYQPTHWMRLPEPPTEAQI